MRARKETEKSASKRGRRRLVLSALALSIFGGPALASGCARGFDSVSKVEGLRVFSVVAENDKSYANPGDEVTFKMTYYDGYVDPENPDSASRPVQILWLGGCFNPAGDAYYGCYPQLAEIFKDIAAGKPPPPGLVAAGIGLDTFTLKLPDDIVSSRPTPPAGPHYGLAYVFFAVCAGELKPVEPEGTGAAGDFPLGCFDSDGKQLGAESFVPGYTQIYVFEDGRPNPNPPLDGLSLDGEPLSDDFAEIPEVEACVLDDEERLVGVGCDRKDPYTVCKSYEIDIITPGEVADIDPDSTSLDGQELREVVWVDYFAEAGDLDRPVRLVSDAVKGKLDDHVARWIAPPTPGLVNIWAVMHDSRGGASVVQRQLRVK